MQGNAPAGAAQRDGRGSDSPRRPGGPNRRVVHAGLHQQGPPPRSGDIPHDGDLERAHREVCRRGHTDQKGTSMLSTMLLVIALTGM